MSVNCLINYSADIYYKTASDAANKQTLPYTNAENTCLTVLGVTVAVSNHH